MRKYVKSNILNNFIKNRSEIIYFGSTFLKGGFYFDSTFLRCGFYFDSTFLKGGLFILAPPLRNVDLLTIYIFHY